MDIERLYKYGSVNEFTEKSLVDSEIWLAAPSSFNDPFECIPILQHEHDNERIMAMFCRMAEKRYPGIPNDETAQYAAEQFQIGLHRKPEVWQGIKDRINKFVNGSVGLFCLTERRNSILMWSHYANDHKGYCLEFECTEDHKFFGSAEKVSYSDEYPYIDLLEGGKGSYEPMFLTKYEDWQYEQEWRIIDLQGPGLRSYAPEFLKSVTFGLRMSEEDKQKMKSWLAQRPTPVKLYQARLGQGRYEITFDEL